jgi:hypothetical protein
VCLEGKELVQGKAVRDKTLAKKALARTHDVALPDADLLGDRGIGPEGAALSVGGQVEKEEEPHLLQAESVENVSQAVVCPGEVRRKSPHPGRVDRFAVGKWCAHKRRIISAWGEEKT